MAEFDVERNLREIRDGLCDQLRLMENQSEPGSFRTRDGDRDTTAESIRAARKRLEDVERLLEQWDKPEAKSRPSPRPKR